MRNRKGISFYFKGNKYWSLLHLVTDNFTHTRQMDAPSVRSVLKEEDCGRLATVFGKWRDLFEKGEMTGHDLAGAFVLSWVATVHGPRKCFVGPIRPPLYADGHTIASLRVNSKKVELFVPFSHLKLTLSKRYPTSLTSEPSSEKNLSAWPPAGVVCLTWRTSQLAL